MGTIRHQNHCGCGCESEDRSIRFASRWLISLAIVFALTFLLRPLMVQQMLARVGSYFSRSSYDEAIRICKKIVLIDHDNIRAWTSMGYAYKDKGDLEKAVDAYTKAFELDPEDPGAGFDLAMAYYSKNEFREAVPYFERVRRQGPHQNNVHQKGLLNFHLSALIMLNECYQQLGDAVRLQSVDKEMEQYDSKGDASGTQKDSSDP